MSAVDRQYWLYCQQHTDEARRAQARAEINRALDQRFADIARRLAAARSRNS